MKLLLLISLAAVVFLAKTEAKPADINDSGVEIEKQRLIKFPDDLDNLQFGSSTSTTTRKDEEAKRILQEIARINQALGYVKKQPEPVKLPPMLDSSQYLFPKPAYHPFHSQKHQFAGSNGATLLVPSIRSLSSEHNRGQQLVGMEKRPASKTQNQQQLFSQLQQNRPQQPTTATHFGPTRYYFRPNEAYRPESSRLDEHFAIPVRLYKLNKEEYLRNQAPQEYRIKGYKIIGDVAHFNSKIKSKDTQKTTPKYHLFFLPRELALKQEQMPNLDVTIEPLHTTTKTTEKPQESAANSSREEKFTLPRPFKNQLSTSTTTNGNVGVTTNSSTTTTQIIRKRIIPKPLKQKEPNEQSVNLQQKPHHVVDGHPTFSKIRITPPPTTVAAQTNNENHIVESSANQVQTASNTENSPHHKNGTGTNAIKTAFQNIFKFPFRHQHQPSPVATERPVELQTVPLQQQPIKTIFAAQPFFGQSFLPQNFLPQNSLPQSIYNNQQQNNDYNWDDEDVSNNAPLDLEDDESTEQQEEKHIFAHAHKDQQQTQKEALRQGGIIIQRLKVRKGGIAIAGPGGVATAGSGGTAIVGPGGYALTHPRSLTIAGPGAKVIAIPSSVDLRDALERTDLRTHSFPREGRIVATGPTVYYAPGTGTGTGMDTGVVIDI